MNRLAGIFACTMVLLAAPPARAGGPRAVNGLGVPMRWNAGTITYHPDQGPLGTLENTEARALLASAFARWGAVGLLSFSEGPLLTQNVNGDATPGVNAAHFRHFWRVEGDGRSPVIFDHDGSVIDGLFGAGARFDILGIGALDTPLGHCSGGTNAGARCSENGECTGGGTCSPVTTIAEASLVINGLFYDGQGLPESPTDVSSAQALEAVMVHEIGHFLNLDHSVVNASFAGDGNVANDIYLPSMFPIEAEDEGALATLHPDDIAALRALYDGSPAAASISGSIKTTAGVPLQGVQVVLRNTSDPLMNAYAAISGARYFPCHAGSVCDPCATACNPGHPAPEGAWAATFLAPGSYKVCVEQIDTRLSIANGTFVGPLATPLLLPGPEECYDLGESGLATDDPDDAATLSAGTLAGIDIRLNALPSPGNDFFEPNNTLGSAAALADLPGGRDTAAAYLASGDLDVFAIPVTAGRRISIDIESAEAGSPLDAVIGLYDGSNTRIALVDDAMDPESGGSSPDPALALTMGFTGTAKVVVSSYPDLDLDGVGGATTGGYWIRVRYEDDHDGDGIPDASDDCPAVSNASQADFDGDALGDACDEDDDNDGLLDTVETNTGVFVNASNTGTNPHNADSDDDGASDGAEVAAATDPNISGGEPGLFDAARLVWDNGGSTYRVVSADVDGDGDTDLIACDGADITWHENADGAGTFNPAVSISPTEGTNCPLAAGDIDGDGKVDVLATVGSGAIVWFRNGGSLGFEPERVVSPETVATWSLHTADIDRDGDLDVVAATATAGSVIAWFENLDGLGAFGPRRTIWSFGPPTSMRAVTTADINGDGWTDVISASPIENRVGWHKNLGSAGSFGFNPRLNISSTAIGVDSVAVGDVDRDGKVDVLSASGTDDKLAWYRNVDGAGGFGAQQVISTAADFPTSIFVADFDIDGDLDVLSTSSLDDEVAWYENLAGAGTFGAQQIVSTDGGARQDGIAADLDGDGGLDIVAAGATGPAAMISWYKNLSIGPRAKFATAQVITASLQGARTAEAADIDGDGDPDVLSASETDDTVAWYENLDGAGNFGTQRLVANPNRPNFASTGDVDGDGDLDVLLGAILAGSYVAWHENLDGRGGFGPSHLISSAPVWPNSILPADLDGDGDADVLFPDYFNGDLFWSENADGLGTFNPETLIDSRTEPSFGIAADLDRDGDLDVVFAIEGDGDILWYENTDGLGAFGPLRFISANAGSPRWIAAADLDRDGDLDIVAASQSSDNVSWFENTNGSGAFGPERIIFDNANSAQSVAVADIDADGDLDVVSASENDDTIAWYENLDGAGNFGPRQVVSDVAGGARSVAVTDMNGDGRPDILAALSETNTTGEVVWYENEGGQYAFKTTDVAPATIANGVARAILRIDLTHLGQAGDVPLALSALEIGTLGANSLPLTAAAANALIENLYVYLDDGSGVFDAADDLVLTVPALAGGEELIAFSASTDPKLLVPPATSKSYFVVAQASSSASSQVPNQFRISHLSGSSVVRSAASGSVLFGEFAPVKVSRVVTAAVPDVVAPTVVGVFPPDGAVDVSSSTNVVLALSEPVDPTSVSPLTVSVAVAGVKAPGRLVVSRDGTLVTFDPDGTLAADTDYRIEVTSGLRDLAGNQAVPFGAGFDTATPAGSGVTGPGQVGNHTDDDLSGRALDGETPDEHFGFAVAAVGDVDGDGIADLVVGSPGTDTIATSDVGKATLVFGGPALQSNAVGALRLKLLGTLAGDAAGSAVARAGDLDHDGTLDFAIGAPRSDAGGADSGAAYVVFGDPSLRGAAPGTIDLATIGSGGQGVVILGADPGDLAGSSISHTGDVDGDGNDDLLIGAPGASPGGRTAAGKAYLVFGPLSAGTIDLALAGCPGAPSRAIVFHGESAGDRLGESVSDWEDPNGSDDLLIGAPGAVVLDEWDVPIPEAGYLYAIHGGTANLGTCGTRELSRVANGQPDQIGGVVFLGTVPNGRIGRSTTGAVDVNDDGIPDVIVGGNNEAWLVSGDGPKSKSGTGTLAPSEPNPTPVLVRRVGAIRAVDEYEATRFTPGQDGNLGDLAVGPAGDVNHDGVDDFVIGAAGADLPTGVDAGKVYLVYGRPGPFGEAILLSDVGGTVSGFTLVGAEPGDATGTSVGGGFDLTGDGVDDAVAGAPFADAMMAIPPNAGRAFVLSPVSPDEVVSLLIGRIPGSARLEWSVPHRALVYNLYRGSLSTLRTVGRVRSSDMVQLACGIFNDSDGDQLPDTTDAALPAIGNGFYYLVTAENLTGEGPLGPAGASPPRVLDAQCP